MDLQTPLTNHQQCIADLQGRIQAHRAFLLLICRRLFNDATYRSSARRPNGRQNKDHSGPLNTSMKVSKRSAKELQSALVMPE